MLHSSFRFRKRHLLWLLPLLALLFAWAAPVPRILLSPPSIAATKILDRNGSLLYEVRPSQSGLQQPLALTAIPKRLISAVLAIEDRGFYSHPGVSFKGIIRAMWQNVTAGRIISGGSTITQQLVRSRLQPNRRTFLSKIAEAFLAFKLEQKLTKDEILEAYLNSAFFGHQAYGVAAAAKTFFGKSVGELSTAECALLAGLPQSPSTLDPFANLPAAQSRQKIVLAAMRETDVITAEEERDAGMEPITLARDTVPILAPHFVMWMMQTRPGALEADSVSTTLDNALQMDVERIVSVHLKELAKQNVTSAAVVVLDARTGDVLAMVGSADYFDATHDGAVNSALAPRQPGSALKPFTYALAFSNGATAATTVADTETQFFTQEGNPYTPRNYDFSTHGLVRYREALANSYNIAAVKVAERVGIGKLLSFLRTIGLTTLTEAPEHYGLALTLGDGEVRLLDLAAAYGIFPRSGRTLKPRLLLSDTVSAGEQVLDPKIAWLVTDILSDGTARVEEFGAEGPLAFPFPVAAKTGTTRNSRDNWTVGFTPDVIVGVWVGNADNSPMRNTSGVTGAGPIFHDAMLKAAGRYPPKDFARPEGIADLAVCALSGKLPTPLCPHTITEHFIEGTEPTEPDDIFQSVSIDTRNGLLASADCLREFVRAETFAVFPKDSVQWALENGWPAPPRSLSPLCERTSSPSSKQPASWILITEPKANDSFALDPLVPDASEQIIFEAQASRDIERIEWFVDGKKIGTGKPPTFHLEWKPAPGAFAIEARSGGVSDQRRISVTR
ncbi:penicillin-binding protein 1C [Candidatus Peribacteria bacterium RIFOXYC2_FULL_58_10]|nr:MAG: penicillin-binding protein 1C [Candidatus Peribacteria bacterium RIFOXYC2_FULL_58_10]OGJ84835.1 MAG: penicillin-binding protein 1C [Candidatus Peribacteria bacterium RIFOXYD2_FULL_58_15]